jgi:chromosomal replication initiator protein
VQTVVEAAIEFAERRLRQSEPPATWLNPLVIAGPCGSGKSHLAHGLASIVAAAGAADDVLLTTAADFATQYLAAIADDSLETMRARIRRARMWVIEDLARLPERKSVQAEFLNRIDEKLEDSAWIVATAPHMPGQLTNLLAATRSRLDAGLTLPLAPPGLEVRREFLRQHAVANGLPLDVQQIDQLARRLPASVRQLQGAIQRTKLERSRDASAAHQSDRNGSAAREVDIPRCGPDEVLAVTGRYFGVSQAALKSPSRARSLVHARSVAMYLARELAGCTLQEIGQALGGRDHTTVLHACRKIDRSASHDAALQEELAELRRLLLST